MMNPERELTRPQKDIAQIICDEKIEQLFMTNIRPVDNAHYRLMKTDASDEVKEKSYDELNDLLDKFQEECNQMRIEAYTNYEDILQNKPVLKERCPDGITIHAQDVSLDELLMYSHYASERFIGGISGEPDRYLPAQPGKLNIEVRLKPDDYSLLHPKDGIYFNQKLADKTGLDTEQNELVMFLTKHPQVMDGIMEVNLQEEKDFLNLLYVDGVPMSKVKEILLQKPQISQPDLQEALQLFRIKQDGVKVVDQQVGLMTRPNNVVASVTRDYQHMYVGEGKNLTSHEYYTNDIRPKYNDALKQAAELELRKLGFIQTLPHSLDVRWANTRGDNWECTQMTHVFNDMFRGYASKIVQAERNEDWMRLDIYTSNPEYQKRIMDYVNHSWAVKEVREITDIEEMPDEIAKAQLEEKAEKEELLTSFVGLDTVYFYEKGTAGFVMMNHDRTYQSYGEPLTEAHRQQIKDIAEHQNIQHSGICVLKFISPERQYIDKLDGNIIRVNEETVDGEKVLIDRINGVKCDMQPERYQEVTGRITEATVITRDNVSYVRCKMDGVQQIAQRLSASEVLAHKNGLTNATTLAYLRFADELIDTAQGRNKGMGR